MARKRAFWAAAAVTAVFFVDWCAVVFQCGCRSLWNGVAAYCNVHAAAGPHCPWCEHPWTGGGIAFGAALVSQWAACYLPRSASLGQRFVLGVIAFPIASGLVAIVQGFVWGYWS